jgi:hypothetical protein
MQDLDLRPLGHPVSCPGYECPLADAPDAERRQHEADVAHWFPQPAPCSYPAPEDSVELVFEVTIQDRATDTYEAWTVSARNGLLALDVAQQEIPAGWVAIAARLA